MRKQLWVSGVYAVGVTQLPDGRYVVHVSTTVRGATEGEIVVVIDGVDVPVLVTQGSIPGH